MPKAQPHSARRRDTYAHLTHRPLNCLAMILPLLVFFHVGTAYYGSRLLAPRDIDRVLRYFGATTAYLPAVLVVTVLLVQHVAHRDPWKVHPHALAGMVAESILWTVPIAAMNRVTGRLLAAAAASEPAELLPQVLRAVGAGIYEEFLFRLVLISVAMLIFVDVFGLRKDVVAVCAAIGSAVLFSLYHFAGHPTAAAEFPWHDFVFRTLAGVYLGALMVTRGFGVAVGAHSFYNIYVAVMRL